MMDPNKIFDGLLVLQYRSGTKKAFSLLVTKYHKKLCSHSHWYTQDLDASKDIVQDCWGIMINKLGSLKDPNLFGSWAFRIVTRKSIDFANRRKKESVPLNEYYQASDTIAEEDNKEKEIHGLINAIQTLPKTSK